MQLLRAARARLVPSPGRLTPRLVKTIARSEPLVEANASTSFWQPEPAMMKVRPRSHLTAAGAAVAAPENEETAAMAAALRARERLLHDDKLHERTKQTNRDMGSGWARCASRLGLLLLTCQWLPASEGRRSPRAFSDSSTFVAWPRHFTSPSATASCLYRRYTPCYAPLRCDRYAVTGSRGTKQHGVDGGSSR